MNRDPDPSATPSEANPSRARTETPPIEKQEAKEPIAQPTAKKAVDTVRPKDAIKKPSPSPDKGRPSAGMVRRPALDEKAKTKAKPASEGSDGHPPLSPSEPVPQTDPTQEAFVHLSPHPTAPTSLDDSPSLSNSEESAAPPIRSTLTRLKVLFLSMDRLWVLLAGTALVLLLVPGLLWVVLARFSDGMQELHGELGGLSHQVAETRGQLNVVTRQVSESRDRDTQVQEHLLRLDEPLRRLDDLKAIRQEIAKLETIRTEVAELRRRSETPLPTRPTPAAANTKDAADVLIVAVNSKNLAVTDFQDVLAEFFTNLAASPRGPRLGFYVAEGATLATRLDVKTGKRAPAGFFIARSSPDTTEMLDEIGPLLIEKLDKSRASRCLLLASSRCRPPSENGAGWKQLAGLDVILISTKGSDPEPEVLRHWITLCSLKEGLLCQLRMNTADGKIDKTFPRVLKSHLDRLTNPVLQER